MDEHGLLVDFELFFVIDLQWFECVTYIGRLVLARRQLVDVGLGRLEHEAVNQRERVINEQRLATDQTLERFGAAQRQIGEDVAAVLVTAVPV